MESKFKNRTILLSIDKLSISARRLNLYCKFFYKNSKLDIKKIQDELYIIKKEIEKIEGMLL